MTREHYQIFSPGKVGGLTIKNRLVRSATAEGSSDEHGQFVPGLLDLYSDLAAGGAGMIITGHMAVMPAGQAGHNQTRIWDDSCIDVVADIARQIHSTDSACIAIAQLSHRGRQQPVANKFGDCTGPSAVPSPILEKTARELSRDEIQEVIDCFVNAILRVKKAGFDGVQLHAAHGWLLSSFLSPYTNQRTDDYGGSLENRMRIISEIVTSGRELVDGFPIMVKINCDDFIPGGVDAQLFAEHVAALEKIGVDAIEVSGGMWDCLARDESELGWFPLPIPEARTRIGTAEKQSYFRKYLEQLNTMIPIILVGGNKNVEALEEIVKSGKPGFISMSRPFISEPDLPNRWMEGRGKDRADCISCNTCFTTLREEIVHCLFKKDKARHKETQNLYNDTWRGFFK